MTRLIDGASAIVTPEPTTFTLASAWWRWDLAPTASEWQAIWAFCTLAAAIVAAWIALRQLSAMRQANSAAADASRHASNASRATMRPYLDVSFEFLPSVPKDPDSTPSSGFTLVVIENRGRSAAKKVRLKSSPEFESSGVGRQGDKDRALEWIREKFSGDYVFEQIPPGKRFAYVLDLTREHMAPERELPQRYEVKATYTDMDQSEEFSEVHVLDAEPWHLSRVAADPLAVIARQLRTMNSYEKKAQKSRDKLVRAVQDHTKEDEPEGA